MQKIFAAQDTADLKKTVFVNTPESPYNVGDLWLVSAADVIPSTIVISRSISDFNALLTAGSITISYDGMVADIDILGLSYNQFMNEIELSSIFFSMIDVETGLIKINSKPAGFVEKTLLDPNAEPEYYIYYRFTSTDTNRVGRYEGQFLIKNDDGNLIVPIREQLFINVQESFVADDLLYDTPYTSNFPCCD
jgi:hypothetical protein